MEFGSLDSGGDCEHNGIGVEEKSKIFMIQDAFFFFETEPFDGVKICINTSELHGVMMVYHSLHLLVRRANFVQVQL